VKVTTQGGPHPGELSFKHIETAVQTAHANGRRIACHAHFNEASIAKAVEARVDSLEHGCVLTPDLAKRMAEFDVAYCPTLEIVARLAEEPALFGVKCESFIKKIREIRQKHLESVHLAMEAGVKIVAGTDAGIAHLEFDGLHRELYRLEQAGLARQDALKAATVTAGNVLAIPGITGILAPGALADFLITSTNPLVDLSTLRKPVAVFVGGRMVRGTLGEANDRLRIDEHPRVN
jgi:imidazolonepropionase-like amidohydrolase